MNRIIGKKRVVILGFLFVCVAGGCSRSVPDVSYQIETDKPCQTMAYFSASDAWSMQFIGLWPEEKQNQVADWLFSTENDANGQPKGIGLSLWRFNVGAGSAEQGEASQIASPWMRAECFLNADGTYDWNKQQGQRNFLKLAKERGVNKFLAFLNSPPVHYTQNGLATNTGRGGTANLKPDCYEKYVRFLADVIQGVEKHDGIKFNYICPFNEPDGHWNWVGPKQEGCPATNKEVAHTVRLLSKEFVSRNMDTQILVNESSDYRCMFRTHETDWQRGYQIQAFFSPDSVDKHQVGFWQTETCIMGNDEEIGGGNGYDRTMKTALYVARIIHHDIVYARAESWQWWRAIGGDYKDGLIREYTTDDNFLDGTIEDSKLMWALGNYSRFIRPGAVRLSVSAFDQTNAFIPDGDTDQQGLMCSAYKNVDGTYVMVVINYANEEKEFSIHKEKVGNTQWQIYRTSDKEGENLLPVGKVKSGKNIQIPARSIITLQSN